MLLLLLLLLFLLSTCLSVDDIRVDRRPGASYYFLGSPCFSIFSDEWLVPPSRVPSTNQPKLRFHSSFSQVISFGHLSGIGLATLFRLGIIYGCLIHLLLSISTLLPERIFLPVHIFLKKSILLSGHAATLMPSKPSTPFGIFTPFRKMIFMQRLLFPIVTNCPYSKRIF